MAIIKSYSDLQQSKKLAEILPLESADMYWWSTSLRYYIEAMDDGDFNEEEGHIRAWSLAALLKTLNFPSLTQNKEDEWEVCVFDPDNDNYIEKTASNPVDACYEMILKLKELSML